MTKRHFEAIAAALKGSKPTDTAPDSWVVQWRADVRAIASVLLAHNPRFDARFYAACGYETTEPENDEPAHAGDEPDLDATDYREELHRGYPDAGR